MTIICNIPHLYSAQFCPFFGRQNADPTSERHAPEAPYIALSGLPFLRFCGTKSVEIMGIPACAAEKPDIVRTQNMTLFFR